MLQRVSLVKLAARALKVRTLCSKWQLERPKYEPYAQNASWSALSTNPLLKMTAGAPKVRTLCPKCKLERPRYNLRSKQFALTFKLLPIMRRQPYLEGSLRKTLRKTLNVGRRRRPTASLGDREKASKEKHDLDKLGKDKTVGGQPVRHRIR